MASVPFENLTPTKYLWVSASGSDSNSGTESSPFRTIQEAVRNAKPGTCIMVESGTYSGFSISKDGADDAPIWIKSADGPGAAKIVGSGIVIGGRDNIVIDGFEVDGGGKVPNGIFVSWGSGGQYLSDNIVIKNNYIHDLSTGDGVKATLAKNIYVIDNKIQRAGEDGIDFVAVNDSVVARNEISHNKGTTAMVIKGGSTNVLVAENYIHDNPQQGISVGGYTDAKWFRDGYTGFEAKNVTVVDNVLTKNGGIAVVVIGARDSDITHNYLNESAHVRVRASDKGHAKYNSVDITIAGNLSGKLGSDWVDVYSGEVTGLKVSNNVVGLPTWQAGPGKGSIVVDWDSGRSAPEPDVGTADPNVITGASASDRLTGTSGADMISGGGGNDAINGGGGTDQLTGGSGADRFIVKAGQGSDVITDFSHTSGDYVALRNFSFSSFDQVKAAMTQSGGDTILDLDDGQSLIFENTSRGDFTANDFRMSTSGNSSGGDSSGGDSGDGPVSTKTGTSSGETITGTTGNDTIDGRAGNDRLNGGDGNDKLNGSYSADTLDGGSGRDTLTGGSSADKFNFNALSGDDVITDFDAAMDDVRFIGTGDNYKSVHIEAVQGGTMVTYNNGANHIVLQGVNPGELDGSNIQAG